MAPQPAATDRDKAAGDSLFLPSFCDFGMVFAVVITAELLALVVVLIPSRDAGQFWNQLGITSMFIQWLALSGSALLCLSRPLLTRLTNAAAAGVSLALVLLTTLVLSEVALWLSREFPELAPFVVHEHLWFVLRNLLVAGVIASLALRYLYVQHQWKQQIEAEARARVAALQARIRPHFLFNSLNTIAALIDSRPEQAEEAVQDLADLFRATLNEGRQQVSLGDEIQIAQRYLHLEHLRLGERLQVQWELQDLPMQAGIPPLILQPLLENAVYHGIEPRPGGGTIHVRGENNGRRVRIEIENPLPGPAAGGRHQGNRIAQENIRQRLQLAFGEQGRMDIDESGDRYRVRLEFPAETTA